MDQDLIVFYRTCAYRKSLLPYCLANHLPNFLPSYLRNPLPNYLPSYHCTLYLEFLTPWCNVHESFLADTMNNDTGDSGGLNNLKRGRY